MAGDKTTQQQRQRKACKTQNGQARLAGLSRGFPRAGATVTERGGGYERWTSGRTGREWAAVRAVLLYK